MDFTSLTPAQSASLWRKSIAAALVVVITVVSFDALRWIWRDITYWSRSVTFTYESGRLESCVELAVSSLPGVAVSTMGDETTLRAPEFEGVIVMPTSAPRVARLVIFGHGRSVSTLGPPSEESVAVFLDQLARDFTVRCGTRSREPIARPAERGR